MDPEQDWTLLAVPEIDRLPRAVMLRSQTLPAHHAFPRHDHPWHQFVYATSGTLLVTMENAWHVITPEQGIWIPAGQKHHTGALHDADFRNLYVAAMPDLRMPRQCTMFAVSPLLRALIVELDGIDGRTESEDYIDRVNGLIIESLLRLKEQVFHLPWPRGRDLRRLCEALYDAPDDPRTADDWGAELGASARTLARRFEAETGMTLRVWRQRLRLFRAMEWLASGRSVTDVALALGYGSPSAFTYMFRQELGCSPTRWRTRSPAPLSPPPSPG